MHCRKTAGSSVKCYLNNFLGFRDIQVCGWHNVLRNKGNTNMRFWWDVISPRCTLNRSTWGIVSSTLSGNIDLYTAFNNIHKKRYYHFKNECHPTAVEAKTHYPDEWSKYFKFCFVRNPYVKAVSDYIFRVESRNKQVSFREFLLRISDKERPDPENVVPKQPDNWPIYTINDNISVDYIGKYERLIKDMNVICKKIGIRFSRSRFPQIKKKKEYDYRKYYRTDEKKLVETIFGREIDQFGYNFQDS